MQHVTLCYSSSDINTAFARHMPHKIRKIYIMCELINCKNQFNKKINELSD